MEHLHLRSMSWKADEAWEVGKHIPDVSIDVNLRVTGSPVLISELLLAWNSHPIGANTVGKLAKALGSTFSDLPEAGVGGVPTYVRALLQALVYNKPLDFQGVHVPVYVREYLEDHLARRT